MAIKKYRVAHGVESVILGVLICAVFFILLTGGEKPNMTNNKEIMHLNKLYQDKLKEDPREEAAKKTFMAEVSEHINPYKDNNDKEILGILNAASDLRKKLKRFKINVWMQKQMNAPSKYNNYLHY